MTSVESIAPTKPWQKGIPLEEIKEYRIVFDARYNTFARSPFTQWNNPKVADSLSKNRIERAATAGYIDTHITTTSTKIKMYFDVELARKQKGDRVINAIAFTENPKLDEFALHINNYIEPTWAIIWEEDALQRELMSLTNFRKIGVKITSFSEIYGIYFRDSQEDRKRDIQRTFSPVDPTELLCVRQLNIPNLSSIILPMAARIRQLDEEFANHYSKHNKSKAWGAVSLRGYSSDPSMIEKPSCMNKKWQQQNEGTDFILQDTPLRATFPEVEKVLEYFPTTNFDRIRLMRLAPGGGELSRHVDHVEKDSGMGDDKIMRFHVPIITNPNVMFTMWNTDGQKVETNMEMGSTWLFDFRKPHMAVNAGNDVRIHLVIDIVMDQKMRDFIV